MLLETRSRGDSGSFAEKEGRRDPAQHRWPGGVPESEMDRATTAETREMLRIVLGTPTPDEALPEDVVDAVILAISVPAFVVCIIPAQP